MKWKAFGNLCLLLLMLAWVIGLVNMGYPLAAGFLFIGYFVVFGNNSNNSN